MSRIKTIHRNLKRLRNDTGLTQQQMSDSLGITRSNYGAMEEGSSTPSPEEIDRICDLFNINLKELIGNNVVPVKKDIQSKYRLAPKNVRKAIDLLLSE